MASKNERAIFCNTPHRTTEDRYEKETKSGAPLTFAGIRRPEFQVVAQDVEVIPHVQLVVPGVVIHSSDVLVLVGEQDVGVAALAQLGVVDVIDLAPGGLALVLLVGRSHHVQDAAHHEGVGGRALVVHRLPGRLEAERVRVELAHHHTAVILLGGIDHPQAPLVHGQVNVSLAAPAIRRGVVVVGVVDNGLAAFDASAQVELDDVSRALLVEEDGAVVGHKACPVHAVRQLVGGRLTAVFKVLQGGELNESVSAVRRPGHEEDLVTGLQGVFAPGTRLLLGLKQEGGVSYTLQSPRTNEN